MADDFTNTENTHQLDQIKHVSSLERMTFGYVLADLYSPLFTASC